MNKKMFLMFFLLPLFTYGSTRCAATPQSKNLSDFHITPNLVLISKLVLPHSAQEINTAPTQDLAEKMLKENEDAQQNYLNNLVTQTTALTLKAFDDTKTYEQTLSNVLYSIITTVGDSHLKKFNSETFTIAELTRALSQNQNSLLELFCRKIRANLRRAENRGAGAGVCPKTAFFESKLDYVEHFMKTKKREYEIALQEKFEVVQNVMEICSIRSTIQSILYHTSAPYMSDYKHIKQDLLLTQEMIRHKKTLNESRLIDQQVTLHKNFATTKKDSKFLAESLSHYLTKKYS